MIKGEATILYNSKKDRRVPGVRIKDFIKLLRKEGYCVSVWHNFDYAKITWKSMI